LELLSKRKRSDAFYEFRSFLKELHSTENLAFWLEVEEYKALTNAADRSIKAKDMYIKFIAPNGRYEINICDALKKELLQKMVHLDKDVDEHLFDSVQRSIFDLMSYDSYAKFLKSERYRRFRERKLALDNYLTRRNSSPNMHLEHEALRKLQDVKKANSMNDLPSKDHLMIHVIADRVMIGTRVDLKMSCQEFIQKQLKKIEYDASKDYGILLVNENRWLETDKPLYFYHDLLGDPASVLELKPTA